MGSTWRPRRPLADIVRTPGRDLRMAKTILVLNGPNLNLRGAGQPETDGQAALIEVEALSRKTAQRYDLTADCRQCSREDEMVDFIHEAHANNMAGIVINAGSCTDPSTALHDALAAVGVPAVEVHLANGHARESFRHHSFAARATLIRLCGFGIEGYRLAISGLAAKLGAEAIA
jgi:3-dehydroquinate dehydratase-2